MNIEITKEELLDNRNKVGFFHNDLEPSKELTLEDMEKAWDDMMKQDKSKYYYASPSVFYAEKLRLIADMAYELAEKLGFKLTISIDDKK